MPIQDTSEIRNKIISIIRTRGPSLPIHIAKETGLSMLFASAFLSELLSEKKIKISNMKVGNSPIYFLPGQEHMLEKFSHHLKSKEKEAFILLKEKKILKDNIQDPAIRIALRAIKDFAIPFKKDEKILWRYFSTPENEIKIKEPIQSIQVSKEDKKEKKPLPEKSQELGIFDKSQNKKERKIKKKTIKKKQNNKFFNKVKEFLSKKSIELSDIESFNKNDLILKIKKNGEEQLLIAYNKKRINESDIIKAHKKALESNLKYTILSLGEPLKKISNLINALKNLKEIEVIKD